MTVRELMEILEMFDEDAEVKLAYQPSWPLCTAVASVKKKDGVVYVCESGYGGTASSKATSTSTLTKAQRKKSNLPNRPPDDGPVAPGRNAPSVAGSPQYL